METLDIELLIDSVKSRPEIWDCSNEAYKNRLKKRDAWAEVCAVVIPGFETQSDVEKNKTGRSTPILMNVFL